MKLWLQLVVGFAIVSVTIGLIYGSMLVSLAENMVPSVEYKNEATQVLSSPGETNEPIPESLNPVDSQPAASQQGMSLLCTPMGDWQRYAVQPGDTFTNLAMKFGTTVSSLLRANCLSKSVALQSGAMINVPEIASSIPASGCGAPENWLIYYVQPGDNLFDLSRLMRVSVSQLQYANCLGNSTTITSGEALKVPVLPAFTPTLTFTPSPSATPFPTSAPPSLTVTSNLPDFGIFPFENASDTPENPPNLKLTPEPPSTYIQIIIMM